MHGPRRSLLDREVGRASCSRGARLRPRPLAAKPTMRWANGVPSETWINEQGTAAAAQLAAGELKGADAARALLHRHLHPSSFSVTVNHSMPVADLAQWLEGFGRAVQLLGQTLDSLRKEIEMQLRRADKKRIEKAVNAIRARIEACKSEMRTQRKATIATLQAAQAEQIATVTAAAGEFNRRRQLATKWRQLCLARLTRACGRHTTVLRAAEQLNELVQIAKAGSHPSGDLRVVADAICTSARRLATSLLNESGPLVIVELLVQDARDLPDDASEKEAKSLPLYKLLPLHASDEQIALADTMVLSCPAQVVSLASLSQDEGGSVLYVPLTNGPSHGMAAILRLERPKPPKKAVAKPPAPEKPPPPPPPPKDDGEEEEEDDDDDDGFEQVDEKGRVVGSQSNLLAAAKAMEEEEAEPDADDAVKGPVFTEEVMSDLEDLAPIFSLALSSCFASASQSLHFELNAALGLLPTRLAPIGPPSQNPDTILLEIGTVAVGWCEDARSLVNATSCCLLLCEKAPANHNLTTIVGELSGGWTIVQARGSMPAGAEATPDEMRMTLTTSSEDSTTLYAVGKGVIVPVEGAAPPPPPPPAVGGMPEAIAEEDEEEEEEDEEAEEAAEEKASNESLQLDSFEEGVDLIRLGDEREPRTPEQIGAIACHQAATTRKAINITDIGCSKLIGPAGLSGVSLLALPLTGSNAELLGVYLCWAYNTFSTEQVSLLRQTLTVGALAIENALLRHEKCVAAAHRPPST